jgi:L-asparaginase II
MLQILIKDEFEGFLVNLGVILAEAYRGEFSENRFTGWLAVSDNTGHLLYSTPGIEQAATFFRSSAKPFQAMPLIQEGFYHDLSVEELAIACASHSATSTHLAYVQKILQKAEMSEEALLCGPHPPLDESANDELKRLHQKPHAIHNNCSGKHAAMLYYCKRSGLDYKTYLDFEHPLQVKILNNLKVWTGLKDIYRAIDGCGAPVFYLSLPHMATLYAKLSTDEMARPIVQAMTTHPFLIGDEQRVDTVLMKATQGKLLAKVGADGVLGVCRVGTGEGFILKMDDGSNEIRDKVAVSALKEIGWLNDEELSHPGIVSFLGSERKNSQEKTIGRFHIHLADLIKH